MSELIIGSTFRDEKTVTPKDSAREYGSGMVDVFATPAMIALMEHACLSLVAPALPKGENTVGTHVDIKHIRATPLYKKVWCDATLLAVEGKKIVFKVEAFDEKGIIGSGLHTRYIIDEEKFLNSL